MKGAGVGRIKVVLEMIPEIIFKTELGGSLHLKPTKL